MDSGLTLNYLLKNLRDGGPASLEVCALLKKKGIQKVEIDVRYCGFEIPPEFVVGYGLDFAERYRNLPYVGTLRPEAYRDAHGHIPPSGAFGARATIGEGPVRVRALGLRSIPLLRRARKELPLAAPESPFRRVLRGPAPYLLIVLVALWLFVALSNQGARPRDLSYGSSATRRAGPGQDRRLQGGRPADRRRAPRKATRTSGGYPLADQE